MTLKAPVECSWIFITERYWERAHKKQEVDGFQSLSARGSSRQSPWILPAFNNFLSERTTCNLIISPFFPCLEKCASVSIFLAGKKHEWYFCIPVWFQRRFASADFAEVWFISLFRFGGTVMSQPLDLCPDVPVCCCGSRLMFESLNCDHTIKPVQTVTHTVRLNELTVVKSGANV